MNMTLENISIWFKANKLALNINKTKYMIFTNNEIKTDHLSLTIENITLEQVSSYKFLGIHIDCRMSWECHISYINKKIACGLYALNSLKHFLPSYNLTMIYLSIVHSHLTYGCLLWGNSKKQLMRKVIVAQKKALRAICHAGYQATTSPLFKAKKILKIDDIFNMQICQFMYKYNYNLLPSPLLNRFNRRNETHQYWTRHCQDYTVPPYKHTLVTKSFIVLGPKKWFSLSANIKKCPYKQFSRILKMNTLQNY